MREAAYGQVWVEHHCGQARDKQECLSYLELTDGVINCGAAHEVR